MRHADRKRGKRADANAPPPEERTGTRAIVLCPVRNDLERAGATGASGLADIHHPPEARLAEAVGLAQAIALDVRESGVIPIARPRPATLFGSGKVEELEGLIRAEEVDLVVVDHPLSPVQQRNLERAWKAKVLDRTGLILEIFGDRAQTKEGRLQVELAHLIYQKSRLVRSWTHLERQRGGVGFMGGPGETQIEADRRMLQERIEAIRKALGSVRQRRELHRSGRRRVPFPIVTLVGYTNAGKSTLFNALTGAGALAEDMLFATLDPAMRAIELPRGGQAILSDTVGFISDLPTTLIAAFRATLEEVQEADLIVHVRDISHPDSEAQKADVMAVLAELGIETETADDHIIEVWNKIDLLDAPARETCRNATERASPPAVCMAARTREGAGDLLALIEETLSARNEWLEIDIDLADGGLINWIYENTQVIDRSEPHGQNATFQLRMPAAKKAQLINRLENG